jgi:hypothetical protein
MCLIATECLIGFFCFRIQTENARLLRCSSIETRMDTSAKVLSPGKLPYYRYTYQQYRSTKKGLFADTEGATHL